MVATIYPSKNISGPANFTAGSPYVLSGIQAGSAPPGSLTVLDSHAIEEGFGSGLDTAHGTNYWTIETDGTNVYAVSPVSTGAPPVYGTIKGSGGPPGPSSTGTKGTLLSGNGFLGLGTMGEEIAVIGAVIVVVVIIALAVHFRR